MAEADTGPAPVLFSGYLDKESKNSKWNRRFFVLEPGVLRYYKDDPEKLPEEERQSRGEIRIRRLSGVAESTVKEHKSCFVLQTGSGPVYLSANTDEERVEWIDSLTQAMKRFNFGPSQSFDWSATPSKKDTSGYRTKVVGGVIVRLPIQTSDAGETSEGGDDTGSIDRHHSLADMRPSAAISGSGPPERVRSAENLVQMIPHHRKDGTRVVRCGHATKQGNVRKNWKRRFFLLDPFGFAYYSSESDRDPIKNIPIQDISSVAACDTFSDRENVFQVVTGGRTFYIQCDSTEDRNLWVSAVQSELHGRGMEGGAKRKSVEA